MLHIVCIRKRETVSYIQYVYDLAFMYRKGGNCIIPAICLCSGVCVPERGKLCHTYSKFIIYILWIAKGETVSYLQYVYVLDFVHQKGELCHTYNMFVLDFVYQKEGNCNILTACLCSRCCVSERGKLYHTYNMFMF
jgi:hypothetical protein